MEWSRNRSIRDLEKASSENRRDLEDINLICMLSEEEKDETDDSTPANSRPAKISFIPKPQLPPILPSILPIARHGRESTAVAGIMIYHDESAMLLGRELRTSRPGDRGPDKKIRAPCRCTNCLNTNISDEMASKCPGRWPRSDCTGTKWLN